MEDTEVKRERSSFTMDVVLFKKLKEKAVAEKKSVSSLLEAAVAVFLADK